MLKKTEPTHDAVVASTACTLAVASDRSFRSHGTEYDRRLRQ
jgi:hypothetical protein